jgi:hypothetical protein
MTLDDKILDTIRKLIGGSMDYTYFDEDIVIHANTYLANLVQVGIGTPGFILTPTSTWRDFLGNNYPPERLIQIRSWLWIKVKLIFDPPMSTHYADKLQEEAKEMLWRMYIEVDPPAFNEIITENP